MAPAGGIGASRSWYNSSLNRHGGKPEMNRRRLWRQRAGRGVPVRKTLPCFWTWRAESSFNERRIMTLEESSKLIKNCADQMNARYKRVVFDEWAVVSLAHKKSRILNYLGPRNDDFLKNFANDLGALRAALLKKDFGVGDFEFARHGVGTLFEAFMVMAEGIYLICNNTANSMEGITQDPRWIEAQVPFVELSDQVRANPLVCAV
jgi:hypothetical protein